MKEVERLCSFGNVKLLADTRRMDILQLLMASTAILTRLARTMKQFPDPY